MVWLVWFVYRWNGKREVLICIAGGDEGWECCKERCEEIIVMRADAIADSLVQSMHYSSPFL